MSPPSSYPHHTEKISNYPIFSQFENQTTLYHHFRMFYYAFIAVFVYSRKKALSHKESARLSMHIEEHFGFH